MIRRICLAIGLLALLSYVFAGCSMLAEPKMAKYEITSDLEQFTDGSMYTTAQTQIPEYVKGQKMEDSRFTEAIVKLKSAQEVRKVVIRRRTEDAVAVDINLFAMSGDQWKLMKEIRGEVKSDIEMKVSPISTDKIKIEAQRATRTADGKSAVSTTTGKSSSKRGAGGGGEVDRILREPLKFAEIEVYGLLQAEAAK